MNNKTITTRTIKYWLDEAGLMYGICLANAEINLADAQENPDQYPGQTVQRRN